MHMYSYVVNVPMHSDPTNTYNSDLHLQIKLELSKDLRIQISLTLLHGFERQGSGTKINNDTVIGYVGP